MLRSKHLVPAVVLALAVTPVVQAAIAIDGVLDAGYTRYATQTNNTGFGDSTIGDGTSTGGSELDAAYGVVENGYLHLFFAGNLENNNNKLQIFIDDGRAGQNTLSTTGGLGGIGNMSGSKFSPDFNGTYAIETNGGGFSPYTFYANKFDLTQTTASSQYLGSYQPNDATAHTLGGVQLSVNNFNAAGVDGTAPSAANAAAAEAVTTGVEMAIPLSQLGSPTGGQVKVLAMINASDSGFLSNQFLPGLPPASANYGNGGKFDFSAVAGQYFSIALPSVSNSGTWAASGGGSWSNAGNWTGSVPQNISDIAILGSSITGDSTITLDGNRTVGRLFLNSTYKYTIAAGSGGTLTIDDTTGTPTENPLISVQLGSHEISAPVSLYNGVNINAVDGTQLTISGAVGGVGNLVKSGGGVLVLSGNNTFVGDLIAEAGTTQINSLAALSGAAIILGDPSIDNQAATLSLGASGMDVTTAITTKRDQANASNLRSIQSAVAGSNTISGTINVNGGVSLGAAAGGTLTVSGVIQNGLDTGDSIQYAVRVNSAGHVILTNANTATGDTFVDAGTLVLNSGASLAGGSLNVFTNGVAEINGSLATGVKIYAQGKVYFPGAGVSAATLSTSTLTVDNGGLIKIANSTSTANPVTVDAGSVEFIGDPANGQIDLTNNQLLTTNDQNTVRQQLQYANLMTSRSDGTLGYKDNGDGRTKVQFAVAGDANLDGAVDSTDFNTFSADGNYGLATGAYWSNGDFDYDGKVNTLDFNILAGHFGNTLPTASPGLGAVVPEPASAALLAIGAVSLLGRRRRN